MPKRSKNVPAALFINPQTLNDPNVDQQDNGAPSHPGILDSNRNKLQLLTATWVTLTDMMYKGTQTYDSTAVKFKNKEKQSTPSQVRRAVPGAGREASGTDHRDAGHLLTPALALGTQACFVCRYSLHCTHNLWAFQCAYSTSNKVFKCTERKSGKRHPWETAKKEDISQWSHMPPQPLSHHQTRPLINMLPCIREGEGLSLGWKTKHRRCWCWW